MATHDYVIDNGTGSAVRADLNLLFKAILTNNSGTTDPSTVISSSAGSKAFSFWADTNSSPAVLKIRNAADDGWIELFQLDGTLTLEDGSASTPGLAFRDDLNTGIFSSAADTFNVATAGVERMELGATTIFNEDGADVDFRIEGDTDANLFYVDAGNDRVGIGTSSPTPNKFHVVHSDYQVARFENTNADANGTYIEMFANSSSPADNDVLGLLAFRGNNSAAENTLYATIRSLATDVTDGTEDGAITFQTRVNGTMDERMRLDSAGRLLLGTTTEGFADFGDTLTIATSADTGITVRSGTSNRGSIYFSDGTSGSAETQGFIQYNHSDGRLVFGTTQTERVRIDGSGNFLVGTTDALSKLTVDTDFGVMRSSNDPTINLLLGTTSSITKLYRILIDDSDSDKLQIRDNDTARITMDGSGNVGIGTTSPTSTLHLDASGGAVLQLQRTSSNASNKISLSHDGTNGTLDSTNATLFRNGGGEKMRIDSSGNVLIGTSSTSNGAVGGKFFDDGKNLSILRGDSSTHLFLNKLNGFDGTVATFAIATATKGSISVTSSATAFNTSSDYRLKENITLLSDGISRLKQLLPKRFNFIADETNTLCDGFLAHEVSSIVPEAITGTKDAVDSEGNIDPQQIDQSKLVPLLVAAVKELIGRVETLEAA